MNGDELAQKSLDLFFGNVFPSHTELQDIREMGRSAQNPGNGTFH